MAMFRNVDEFVERYSATPDKFTNEELVALMVNLYSYAYSKGYNRGYSQMSLEKLFESTKDPMWETYDNDYLAFNRRARDFRYEREDAERANTAMPLQDFLDKWAVETNAKLSSKPCKIEVVDEWDILKDFSKPITKVETEKEDGMIINEKFDGRVYDAMAKGMRESLKSNTDHNLACLCDDIELAMVRLTGQMPDASDDTRDDEIVTKIAKLSGVYMDLQEALDSLFNNYETYIEQIEDGEF